MCLYRGTSFPSLTAPAGNLERSPRLVLDVEFGTERTPSASEAPNRDRLALAEHNRMTLDILMFGLG